MKPTVAASNSPPGRVDDEGRGPFVALFRESQERSSNLASAEIAVRDGNSSFTKGPVNDAKLPDVDRGHVGLVLASYESCARGRGVRGTVVALYIGPSHSNVDATTLDDKVLCDYRE